MYGILIEKYKDGKFTKTEIQSDNILTKVCFMHERCVGRTFFLIYGLIVTIKYPIYYKRCCQFYGHFRTRFGQKMSLACVK